MILNKKINIFMDKNLYEINVISLLIFIFQYGVKYENI